MIVANLERKVLRKINKNNIAMRKTMITNRVKKEKAMVMQWK